MKTFNLSTLAFVILAVVIAASQTDAECTDVECTFESGEWGEWGQCSETCSIGWRERIFWGKLPSGYVTQTKERQKCALSDINCEAIVEDCVGDYLRCCKNEDKDENCKKGSKTEHCKKPLCTNLDGTCKEDEFKCRNGPCIPNDWRCDKEEDCWDRSDEDSC